MGCRRWWAAVLSARLVVAVRTVGWRRTATGSLPFRAAAAALGSVSTANTIPCRFMSGRSGFIRPETERRPPGVDNDGRRSRHLSMPEYAVSPQQDLTVQQANSDRCLLDTV